ALAEANALGDQNGPMAYWIHMTILKRDRGQFGDVEPFARAMIQLLHWNPAWRCVLSMILAETGRPEEARRELEIVAKDDFAGIPPDLNYLTALNNAAETSALIGDVECARVVYR